MFLIVMSEQDALGFLTVFLMNLHYYTLELVMDGVLISEMPSCCLSCCLITVFGFFLMASANQKVTAMFLTSNLHAFLFWQLKVLKKLLALSFAPNSYSKSG